MVKPLFPKLVLGVVVILVVAGMGLVGLSFWRDRVETEIQDVEIVSEELRTGEDNPIIEQPSVIDPEVSETDTSAWETYRNEEFGFEISHPLEWDIVQSSGGDVAIFLVGKEKFPTPEECPRCWLMEYYVAPHQVPYPGLSFSVAVNAGFPEAVSIIEGVDEKQFQFVDTTFQNLPAHKRILNYAAGRSLTDVFFDYRGNGWKVHHPNIDNEGNYDDIYDQILSTFRLLDNQEVETSDPHEYPREGVTVVSPSVGDKWVMGNVYTIRWQPDNSEEEVVDITLINLDAPDSASRLVYQVPEVIPNTGKYSIMVPIGIVPGDNYQVVVYVANLPQRGSSSFNVGERGYSGTFSIISN